MKYKHHPKQEYPDAQQQEDEKIIAALREVRERRAARPSEVMEDYYEGFKSSLATRNPVQRSTGQAFRPEPLPPRTQEQKAQEWMERHAEPGYEHISAGLNPFNPSAIDWRDSHKSAEQERQDEEDIEKAIDQVENQKQQAGFYAGATERLGIKSVTSDMEFPKEWKGEFIPPAFDLSPAEPVEKKVGFYCGGPWKEQLTERDEREGCAPWYAMTENGVVETRPWEGEGEPNPDYRTPTLFERFNSLCTPAQYVQLKMEIRALFESWLGTFRPRYGSDGKYLRCLGDPEWPQELEGFTEEIIESL